MMSNPILNLPIKTSSRSSRQHLIGVIKNKKTSIMNNSVKEHYTRIKAEMEKEELLTFEELLNLTKVSPTVLTQTIHVLANERFPVKKGMNQAFKNLCVKANKDNEVS